MSHKRTLVLGMLAAGIATGMALGDNRAVSRARHIAKDYVAELDLPAVEREDFRNENRKAIEAAEAKREARRLKRLGVRS